MVAGTEASADWPLLDIVDNPYDFHRRVRRKILINLLSNRVLSGEVFVRSASIDDPDQRLRSILCRAEMPAADQPRAQGCEISGAYLPAHSHVRLAVIRLAG